MHAIPNQYTNDICIILINWTCTRNRTTKSTKQLFNAQYDISIISVPVFWLLWCIFISVWEKSIIGKQTTNTCTESFNFVTIMIYASFESLKPIKPITRARIDKPTHKWYMHHFDQLNLYEKQHKVPSNYSKHDMI